MAKRQRGEKMNWDQIDEFLHLEELTAEELQVLTAQEAMIRLQRNANMLAQVNNLLLVATTELNKWRTIVDKLKHTKNTLIEQNRALKEFSKLTDSKRGG